MMVVSSGSMVVNLSFWLLVRGGFVKSVMDAKVRRRVTAEPILASGVVAGVAFGLWVELVLEPVGLWVEPLALG